MVFGIDVQRLGRGVITVPEICAAIATVVSPSGQGGEYHGEQGGCRSCREAGKNSLDFHVVIRFVSYGKEGVGSRQKTKTNNSCVLFRFNDKDGTNIRIIS